MNGGPSGKYYDYTITMKPERPWLVAWHQSLVYRIMHALRGGDGNIDELFVTFEQADMIEDLPDELYTSGPVYFEFREIPGDAAAFHRRFCPAFIPWFYKNNPRARGDQQMVDGTDLCMPALWCEERTLVAYSQEGYASRTWELPPDWQDVRNVAVARMTLEDPEPVGGVPVVDGRIPVSLAARRPCTSVPVEILRPRRGHVGADRCRRH